MTEERINQISKDCGNGVATRREMKVHKAVAAEARKEGIDKMRDVAKLCNDTRRYPGTILSAQEFERWVDREIDKMAKRLKEQG